MSRKYDVELVCDDCIDWMASQPACSVDVVVTSPPYNLGVDYKKFDDCIPRDAYLKWLGEVFAALNRVLRDDGHFFLNLGYSNVDPWVDMEVASVAREYFVLQNRITWVKSISIDDETCGHFKPVNSPRFLNATNEIVFHFTKSGRVSVDRQAVGVPYKWKCNLDKRSRIRGRLAKAAGYENWRDFESRATAAERRQLTKELNVRVRSLGHVSDRRCRGNTWFVPYDTIRDRVSDRGAHPATFPVALPEMCIRFSGCDEGATVFDPFVGSGTTMLAAASLRMRGIGTDIDRAYLDFAATRLGSVRGKAAVVEASRSCDATEAGAS